MNMKLPHVFIDEDGTHVNAYGNPIVAEVGCDQTVTIDKLFGPLIFTDLRVTAEFATNEWVIERQRADTSEWVIVARVPGQVDAEFVDADEAQS